MKEKYDNIDEYIADLKAEIAQNEQCANHHYNLGVALLSKRDFVAAEESFLEAARNSPHLAEAYVQLGGICLHRGDLQGCLRYNEEAANCRAKFPVPQANIGFVYLQLGKPEKALEHLRKAEKWDPQFLQAKNGIATALFMQEKNKECEEKCLEMIKIEPNFAPAWNNLALAYFDQKEYKKAIEACDKAAELGFKPDQGFLDELAPYRDQA